MLFALGRFKMARFDPNADAESRTGMRANQSVMLRVEYELLRSLARRRAELAGDG